MLRLASDADVRGEIIRGLRRRSAQVDLPRAQDSLGIGAKDEEVLAWAAAGQSVLITNDRNTMIGLASDWASSKKPTTGIIVNGADQSIGSAINDILLIAEVMPEEEIRNQIAVYLPFRG